MKQLLGRRIQLDTRGEVLLLFAMLNVLDLLTTRVGLIAGIPEGNPIPAAIIANEGFETYVLVKAALVATVCVTPLILPRFRRFWMAVHLGSAILAVAVTNNILLLLS